MKIENQEELRKFQYRAFIKNVYILLPGYKYLHSTSDENSDKFVGRELVQKQFLNFLKEGGSKGAYLVTGYRGMGKTTLVTKVVNSYKCIVENEAPCQEKSSTETQKSINYVNKKQSKPNNTGKHVTKISISFGQKNITEHDILKQIVHEIKNRLNYEKKYKNIIKIKSNRTIPFIIAGAFLLISILCDVKNSDSASNSTIETSHIVTQKPITDVEPLNFINITKFDTIETRIIETSGKSASTLQMNINDLMTRLVISLILGFLIFELIKVIMQRGCSQYLEIQKRVQFLFDRCTSQITSEESAGTGAEQFPIILAKRKSQFYPIAGAKEISNELIHLIREIKELGIEFVFVFDELDKIDNNSYPAFQFEDTELLDYKGETVSFSDHRKRKRLILDILSSLKYLITEAEAKFIFIAGSEMFDAAMADVSDRHSAISSIFGHVINVDSLYKDKTSGDVIGVGITNLIESFLMKLIDPNEENDKTSILKYNWEGGNSFSTLDKLKVIYTLQHFINYLAYRCTGSPKKMIRIIEQHTRQMPSSMTDHLGVAVRSIGYIGEHGNIYLTITYRDQYKIGLLNYFYRPIIISKSRIVKNYSDTLLVTIPYLMDHINKFHGSAFSMENLELLPEILASNRAPELRMFLEELIEQFKQNLIRETETKFFDYKFNYKIYNEIVNVSRLFAEESAAYNFTLDENYNIKVYLRLKIKELRSIYKDFEGADSTNSLDSIALYNTLLGDITYYDREYGDAVGCYLDALTAMQHDDEKSTRHLSTNNLHFIGYIRCLMKLGLSYEKMKSYEKAVSCFLDVIDVIGKNRTTESKYILKEETDRYLMNAVFSCLFIFEKQPALGGFKRLYNKILLIGKMPSKTKNANPNSSEDSDKTVIKFRDFLFKQPFFYNNISLLLYYRNTKFDANIVKRFSNFEFLKSMPPKQPTNRENVIAIVSLINKSLLLESEFTSIKDIIINAIKGYENKDIAMKTAYSIARGLSRIGNLYYSVYFERDESKISKEETIAYRNKLNNDLEALIKATPKEIITKDGNKCSRKKMLNGTVNASDLIKLWLKSLPEISIDKETGIINEPSLSEIVYFYILSAKLYMYSGRALMGNHQYRKILAILRHHAGVLKDLREKKKEEIDFFLDFIKVSLVKRCLQVSSWMSASTDRSQVYKYKHALGLEFIYHDKSWTKYNYKSTSNSADTKESLWHYVSLDEICRPDISNMKPSDVIKKNTNQSFINQISSIHTLYARLNELQVQCVINNSLLNNFFPDDSIDIKKIYNKIRKERDYSKANLAKGYGLDEKKIENLNELPYLIANWIFCLHSMLQIMQTKSMLRNLIWPIF